jgi:hypothetical protein
MCCCPQLLACGDHVLNLRDPDVGPGARNPLGHIATARKPGGLIPQASINSDRVAGFDLPAAAFDHGSAIPIDNVEVLGPHQEAAVEVQALAPNTASDAEHLVGATAGEGPFWPTFGGTCNNQLLYYLPAGASCTFQWGFKPEKLGQRRDTGQISFESGASVSVELEGRGTPH